MHLFLDGEEVGNEGRAFAHTMDGTSNELPRLGKFSWENSVPNPATGDKTVVVGLDDSTPGQVYVYVGTKSSAGSPVDKAGLTGGALYGVKVDAITVESRATGIPSGTGFTLHSFGNVANMTGAALQTASTANGIIDVSDILGEGWFLLDVQAHFAIAGELVEGGQLIALHYPPGRK